LKEYFDIKDLGFLKYLRKYILDLLKETGKLGCKPVSTPIDNKYKLNTEDGESVEDINHFQRLVGRLIYLTVT
jgi:hypothetical protein